MVAHIYKDGKEIDRIVANESYAKAYCDGNGYTYEMEERSTPPMSDPAYTSDDLLSALLGMEDNSSGGG